MSRTPRRALLAAGLALTAVPLAAPAAPAGAATTVVARPTFPTPIAAYGGWVAWSEPTAIGGPFRLTLRRPDGTIATPAIAARSVPFDVDLGPGVNGGVVAAYSRCAREPQAQGGYPTPTDYPAGRGCVPYLLAVTGGPERRIAGIDAPDASEVWPSPWRGAIAFERVYDAKRDYPYVYVGRSDRKATSQRQVGGPRKGCTSNLPGRRYCGSPLSSSAAAVELYGRRLAFAWRFAGTREGYASQIRLDEVGGDGEAVASFPGGGSLTAVELGWPAFEDGWLLWSRECYGDPQGCPGRYGLERRRIVDGTPQRVAGPRTVISHDRAAGRTYLLTGNGCLNASLGCDLEERTGVFAGG